MSTTPPEEQEKPKRTTWTIDPPEDIERMVVRALKDLYPTGKEPHGARTKVLVRAIRKGLAKYALKRDLAFRSEDKI